MHGVVLMAKIECSNCGAQIEENMKFCTECGSKMELPETTEELKCPSCSAQLPPNTSFCTECGTKIETTQELQKKLSALNVLKNFLVTLSSVQTAELTLNNLFQVENHIMILLSMKLLNLLKILEKI